MAAFKCLEIYTERHTEWMEQGGRLQGTGRGAAGQSWRPAVVSQARRRRRRTLHLCRFNGRVWFVRLFELVSEPRCKLSLSENTSNLRRINQTERGNGKGAGDGVQVKRTALSAFGHLKCV